MFSRWLFVRLGAAEKALYNGRIDEAYRAATQPDVREHRRAQKLLDEMTRPILARARLNAEAGRYREAIEDLDKLEAVGRGGSEARELRGRATHAMKQRRVKHADRNDAYARAADEVRAGRLESGRVAIERVPDSDRREQLRDELDARAQRSEEMLAQAEAALEKGDVLSACRVWEDACKRHGRGRAADELAARLAPAFRGALDALFKDGQLSQFVAALRGTETLRGTDPSLDAYERAAALCSQIASELAAQDHTALRETLLRLQAAQPDAGWLKAAAKTVAAMIETRDSLLASPLGLLAPGVEKNAGIVMSEAARLADTLPRRKRAGDGDESAAPLGRGKLLMLLDGTCSCVLTTRDIIRIGRSGGDPEIDVPIPADIQSHHAKIIRDGDDYFLVAHGPARVNRRPVQRALLRDNDRIVLGTSAKFVFNKPSSKSETAVLKMSDRCRLPLDVSYVVLFRDTCLIGPQVSSHIRTREGDSRLVLFERMGRLYARLTSPKGGPAGRSEPVRLNETQDFGDLRLTVKNYELPGTGNLT